MIIEINEKQTPRQKINELQLDLAQFDLEAIFAQNLNDKMSFNAWMKIIIDLRNSRRLEGILIVERKI
jgi:hypothetical protein